MDKKVENIIKKVANSNSISHIRLQIAYDIFCKNVKKIVQREEMPTVMIHNFGTLYPDKRKINKRLSFLNKRIVSIEGALENVFGEEKETLLENLEFLKKDRERLLAVKERIDSTKHIRKKKSNKSNKSNKSDNSNKLSND